MSRNAESRFALNPTNIDISRSRFNRNSSVKTSFNVGQVIPFYIDEVLPGDTFSVKTNKVVRMQTLITPVMDNIYLDSYYFYVPARLTWKHWKQFMGENTESAWIPQTEYSVPQLVSPAGGFQVGTIADYLGVPTGVDGLHISAPLSHHTAAPLSFPSSFRYPCISPGSSVLPPQDCILPAVPAHKAPRHS